MLNANKDIDFLTDQLREFAVPVFAINEKHHVSDGVAENSFLFE